MYGWNHYRYWVNDYGGLSMDKDWEFREGFREQEMKLPYTFNAKRI
jgi:hypothetical protein